MKNIGMILRGYFPPDIRVEKEAAALIKAGFFVYILCLNRGEERREEIVKGIYIKRILPQNNFFIKIILRINDLIHGLFFIHILWAKEIKKFNKKNNVELLHIHDLPLVKTGIRIAKKNNIPVIADLHENYPAALQAYDANKSALHKFILSPLKNLKKWIIYEKKCVNEADRVIVVVDEAKNRLLKYNCPEEKIVVVSNVVDVKRVTGTKADKSIIKKYDNNFVISYIGGFGPHRGIDCVVKAMKYLGDKKARLVLVGNKNKTYYKELKKLAIKYGVDQLIDFISWQPFEKILSYIKASDICLVPHNKSDHTDSTIPHKLFQYMLMEKPVIVSNCLPLKRIVEETNSGLVFEADNPRDLAEKITELYEKAIKRRQLGKNGKKAVLKKYNWEKESVKLVGLYKQFEKKAKKNI